MSDDCQENPSIQDDDEEIKDNQKNKDNRKDDEEQIEESQDEIKDDQEEIRTELSDINDEETAETIKTGTKADARQTTKKDECDDQTSTGKV